DGGTEGAKTLSRVGLRVEVGLQIAFEHAVGLDIGNITQEGQMEISLDVILALDRIIEVIDKENQADRRRQTAEDAEKQSKHDARLDGSQRHDRLVHHAHVLGL